METDFTLERISHAIGIIEDFRSSKITRDSNKLDEILPLVLIILKKTRTDMEQERAGNKFYAPAWVDTLLMRLSGSDEPLSYFEYGLFHSKAESLTENDYKAASPDLDGYKTEYVTPQEISETVCSLKRYFKLI